MEQQTFPSRFPCSPARSQRGAALLIFMAVLMIAAGVAILGSLRNGDTQQLSDQKTADALAQAKAALIGYAAADPNRPGELPCPDFNNDGDSTPVIDYSGSNCKTLIGWLPWRLLRLPDLRDGSGERLWYAIANDFHANGTTPLNSAVSGALSITGSQPVNNVVAIVFAPGAPLPRQSRPTAPASMNISRYLEGLNATGGVNRTFEARIGSATFNDKLLALYHDELFGVVNKRIAAEIRGDLTTGLYRAYAESSSQESYRVFPLAALADGSRAKSGFVPYSDPTFTASSMLTNNRWLTDSVTYTVANDQKTATITVKSPSKSLCLTPTAATPCVPTP